MKSPSKRRRRIKKTPNIGGNELAYDHQPFKYHNHVNPFSILDQPPRTSTVSTAFHPKQRTQLCPPIMPNKQSHHNTYFGDSLHDSTDGFTLVKLRRLHPSNKFQSKCKTQPTYHSSHIALQSNKSRKSNTFSLTKKSHIHQKRKSILPLFTSHPRI